MRGRWLAGLLFIFSMTGCETTGGFAFFAAAPAPIARLDSSCANVIGPTCSDVELQVESLRRGVRGGSMLLCLHNDSPDKALMLDWSKLNIRLGNGQFRSPMTDDEFLKLATEFTFAAYGWNDDDLKRKTPDIVYPHRGEVRRLRPGEDLRFMVHFGAPEEESGLMLDFTHALTWETVAGQRLGPVMPALRCGIKLPPLKPEKPADWWPDWLHLGFVVTNGM